MNTAGIRGRDPEFGRVIDGWVYIDMYSDANATLDRAARGRAGCEPHGRARWATTSAASSPRGWRARPSAPREGVKDGLEQVKWLPAAEGHEGTLLGFGNHDRGALHGRYLVLRQWRDGRLGRGRAARMTSSSTAGGPAVGLMLPTVANTDDDRLDATR